MAMSRTAAQWLDQYGTGPLLAVVEGGGLPSDWSEELQTRYPELTVESADELIGFGLRAREAARGGALGADAPVEPLGRTGRPRAAAARRWRYRVIIEVHPVDGGPTIYRTQDLVFPGAVTEDELVAEAKSRADTWAEEGKYGLTGMEVVTVDVRSVSQF